MVFSTLDNFFLTDEQLENSPSRKDGIDKDTESEQRAYGCALIQEAGVLLAFQQAVMATGQVLFHRFYCKRSMKTYNVKKLAATALWQGAKLEEVPEVSGHPRELLNKVMVAIDRCIARRETPEGRKLGVLDLHSKEAEEFRRSLIRYELEMLKAFGFITHVDHPHKLLLNYCQIMTLDHIHDTDAPQGEHGISPFVQEAWNVANDSLRTTLCVRHKSSVVACGIIFYTARKLKVPLPDSPPWWKLFGVQLPQIYEVCTALYHLYRAPKARFIPVCHQLLPSKPPTPATPATQGGAAAGDQHGTTPMLGRPGGKPLDPSVRLPVESTATGATPSQGATANGTAPRAAASSTPAGGAVASAPPSVGPSPQQQQEQPEEAPGSAQRKRSRSHSPADDDSRKRQQRDSTQPAAAAAGAAGGQQQRQRALFPPPPGGSQKEQRPPAQQQLKQEADREREREHSSRGQQTQGLRRKSSRSRSRDRDRDRGSTHRRSSRSRSRSRSRGDRGYDRRERGYDRDRGHQRDGSRGGSERDRPRHHHRDRREGKDSRDDGRHHRAGSKGREQSQSQQREPSPGQGDAGGKGTKQPSGGSVGGYPPPPASGGAAAAGHGAAAVADIKPGPEGPQQQGTSSKPGKPGADGADGADGAAPAPKPKPVAVRKKPPAAPAAGAGAAGAVATASAKEQHGGVKQEAKQENNAGPAGA